MTVWDDSCLVLIIKTMEILLLQARHDGSFSHACGAPTHTCIEHADQSDHMDSSQSTGHACVLHDSSMRVDDGHAMAVGVEGALTVRVAKRMPPPHLADRERER